MSTNPATLAIHQAICEDSISECLEDYGNCVKATEAIELPLPVLDFINARPEYVSAARKTPGDQDQTDYNRWQGHMEARRQLAQALGYTVPYEHGDKTTKKEES